MHHEQHVSRPMTYQVILNITPAWCYHSKGKKELLNRNGWAFLFPKLALLPIPFLSTVHFMSSIWNNASREEISLSDEDPTGCNISCVNLGSFCQMTACASNSVCLSPIKYSNVTPPHSMVKEKWWKEILTRLSYCSWDMCLYHDIRSKWAVPVGRFHRCSTIRMCAPTSFWHILKTGVHCKASASHNEVIPRIAASALSFRMLYETTFSAMF